MLDAKPAQTSEPRFKLDWPLLVTLVMLACTVCLLRFEGRIWWCALGDLSPWCADASGPHNSQHVFDPYCVTHMLHGLVFWGGLSLLPMTVSTRWRVVAGLSLEALWEVLENSAWVIDRYRTATAAVGYTGDSVLNSLGDIVACGVGLAIAQRLGWRWSAVLFAVAELLVLVWIRDSLTLNVVMLVYPIEAIRHWQMR